MTLQERNEYNEGDVVLLTNWKSKININKPYFKKKKLAKRIKKQRTERYDIIGVVNKEKIQICNVRIIEITMKEKTLKLNKKIRVPFDFAIKLN